MYLGSSSSSSSGSYYCLTPTPRPSLSLSLTSDLRTYCGVSSVQSSRSVELEPHPPSIDCIIFYHIPSHMVSYDRVLSRLIFSCLVFVSAFLAGKDGWMDGSSMNGSLGGLGTVHTTGPRYSVTNR